MKPGRLGSGAAWSRRPEDRWTRASGQHRSACAEEGEPAGWGGERLGANDHQGPQGEKGQGWESLKEVTEQVSQRRDVKAISLGLQKAKRT